jgi:hypothetical protein
VVSPFYPAQGSEQRGTAGNIPAIAQGERSSRKLAPLNNPILRESAFDLVSEFSSGWLCGAGADDLVAQRARHAQRNRAS